MLITPERKVPQRSDASQNDHKSKGYPTSAAAFNMTWASDLLKSGSTALIKMKMHNDYFQYLILILIRCFFQRLLFTFVMNQLTFKTLLMSAFIVDFEFVSGFSVRLKQR